MTRTATILWCILIGAITGLYAIIWANLPMGGYMWIAFIALPLYFTCGADPKLLPQHIVCAICGVLWGVLTLAILGLGLFGGGLADLFIVLLVVVALCCVVHMVLLPANVMGGLFSNAPMVFGGYAGIFSQGQGEALGVIATLVGGLLAGVLVNLGGAFIAKNTTPAAAPVAETVAEPAE